MGKGSGRRPSNISRSDMEAKWAEAFGPRAIETAADPSPLAPDRLIFELETKVLEQEASEKTRLLAEALRNIEDRNPERDPYWIKSGYRGEYTCPCGVGHGNHVHGCCGKRCCTRPDYPLLKRRPNGDD